MSTETRFTPGPWWMDASRYGTVYVEANAVIDKRMLQEICAVGPTESGREQQMSNAALIAAAPDMYVALKDAREYVSEILERRRAEFNGYERTGRIIEVEEALRSIDDALTKAEGKA